MTESRVHPARRLYPARRGRLMSALGSPAGLTGVTMLLTVVAVAIVGPYLAPHSPAAPVGPPFASPSRSFPLGTDFLGRDVLSRLLWGGRSVLGFAGIATVLAYAAGLAIGLVAGYSTSIVDPILMRAVDVLLSFPTLIFMLVVITALGTGPLPLVLGVAIVQTPSIARIMRTATLEQTSRGFVEAGVARGEPGTYLIAKEILPNITGPIAADAGLRLTYSILIIASVNFLGLGLQPPAADWGLMVAENRGGIDLNSWGVLAPAALIASLTISLNLVGDALARAFGGRSSA
jgi:peptide/nickel transport system permease protein